MKRIFIVFLVSLLLLTTGCSQMRDSFNKGRQEAQKQHQNGGVGNE